MQTDRLGYQRMKRVPIIGEPIFRYLIIHLLCFPFQYAGKSLHSSSVIRPLVISLQTISISTGRFWENQSNRMTADNIFLGSRHVHAKCFHSVPTYAKQPSDIHSSFLPTSNGKLSVSKKDDPSCQTVQFFFIRPPLVYCLQIVRFLSHPPAKVEGLL